MLGACKNISGNFINSENIPINSHVFTYNICPYQFYKPKFQQST